MEIDLTNFCDPNRAGLTHPFSINGFTYASNGRIMVRVPRRPDVPENPQAPVRAAALFEQFSDHKRYRKLPTIDLVEPYEWDETITCEFCDGSGKQHSCPNCSCKCPSCDGAGSRIETRWQTTSIGRASFESKYIAWLQALPELEVGKQTGLQPLHFRFTGGEGLLMPCEQQPQRQTMGEPA
jgi:hypothetical protein